MLLADLLSLHLVTFLMFFILVVHMGGTSFVSCVCLLLIFCCVNCNVLLTLNTLSGSHFMQTHLQTENGEGCIFKILLCYKAHSVGDQVPGIANPYIWY